MKTKKSRNKIKYSKTTTTTTTTTSTTTSTTTTTTTNTTTTTTNTTSPSVICKHITYCDWSNSTKNPHTFIINSTNNFPTSIAITAKCKGKMIFLRKIKFPLHDKSNDNNNYCKKYNHQEHSRNSEMTTNNDDHKVLNEVQISFLKEWLSCLLSDEISNKSNNDDDEDNNDYRSNRMKKEVRIIVAANNNEVNNLSRWIQLANKILYHQSTNDRYSNHNNVDDDDDAVVAASSISGRRYDDNHYRDDRCNNTDYNDNMMKKKRKHQ